MANIVISSANDEMEQQVIVARQNEPVYVKGRRDFFKYRDGSPEEELDPHPFKNTNEF